MCSNVGRRGGVNDKVTETSFGETKLLRLRHRFICNVLESGSAIAIIVAITLNRLQLLCQWKGDVVERMFRSFLSYIFSVVDSFTRVPALLSGKLLGNNCCVLLIVVMVNNGATAHKRSYIQSNPLRCEKKFQCNLNVKYTRIHKHFLYLWWTV